MGVNSFNKTMTGTFAELESCMIKHPPLAFGFTIDDKTLSFKLFHVTTSFQLSTFYT